MGVSFYPVNVPWSQSISIKKSGISGNPTVFSTVSEPQNQGIGEFCVVQKHRATDSEAAKS